ncbi:MAG: hypothetical protein IPM34_13785 [Saprospiraceae bacterium]|nr:hypothetical protein [Saprospiraceae bacterium]
MPIQLIHTLEGHQSAIYTMSPGAQGTLLSAGGDGWIVSWDPETSNNGQLLAKTDSRIFSLHYLEGSNMIIAGSMEGELFFIPMTNPDAARRLKAHRASIYKIIAIGESIASIGGDGIISIWDPVRIELLHQYQLSATRLRSISYDQEFSKLYIGDHAGDLYAIDLPGFEKIEKQTARHKSAVFSQILDASQKRLITGGLDAQLKISNGFSDVFRALDAHWFCINDICILAGTSWLATASRDKSIRIWDSEKYDLVKELSRPNFAAHQHSVNALVWYPGHHLLCSASDDKKIICWKID